MKGIRSQIYRKNETGYTGYLRYVIKYDNQMIKEIFIEIDMIINKE